MAFCALVGGQDELVFDGHSFVVDHDGKIIARAPQFEEALLVCDVDTDAAGAARLRDTRRRRPAREAQAAVDHLGSLRTPAAGTHAGEVGGPVADTLPEVDEVYAALVLGRATTRARTASATSCSGCRAGSTRRSWRSSPSTRSGPRPSPA